MLGRVIIHYAHGEQAELGVGSDLLQRTVPRLSGAHDEHTLGIAVRGALAAPARTPIWPYKTQRMGEYAELPRPVSQVWGASGDYSR